MNINKQPRDLLQKNLEQLLTSEAQMKIRDSQQQNTKENNQEIQSIPLDEVAQPLVPTFEKIESQTEDTVRKRSFPLLTLKDKKKNV